MSAVIDNDAFGMQARQIKDTLGGQLSKRYGSGRSVDQLLPGSIWTEPREWAQSLSVNQRNCFVVWEKTSRAELPADLDSVFLGINGFGSDQTSVFIEYSSIRLSEAESEIQDMLADLL